MLAASSRQLPLAGGSPPHLGGGQQRQAWAVPAARAGRRQRLLVQATTQSKPASSRQRSRGALGGVGGQTDGGRSFWTHSAGSPVGVGPSSLFCGEGAACGLLDTIECRGCAAAVVHSIASALPIRTHPLRRRRAPSAPPQCGRRLRSSSRRGSSSGGSTMSCRASPLCAAPQTCLS